MDLKFEHLGLVGKPTMKVFSLFQSNQWSYLKLDAKNLLPTHHHTDIPPISVALDCNTKKIPTYNQLSIGQSFMCIAMIGENRQLVTDEPVEFEKQPVAVQDFRRIIDHFRRNLENITQINIEKPKDVNM